MDIVELNLEVLNQVFAQHQFFIQRGAINHAEELVRRLWDAHDRAQARPQPAPLDPIVPPAPVAEGAQLGPRLECSICMDTRQVSSQFRGIC